MSEKHTPDLLAENEKLAAENERLKARVEELEDDANEAFNCLQDISKLITNETGHDLDPGKIADYKKWEDLLIKVIWKTKHQKETP